MSLVPFFSIVIPTYNHATSLVGCLESVIGQSYANWEAIIVNNYSTDATIDIVSGYQDPRIRLVNFSNNGVIAASRREGLRLARGDYVAFLDSDDEWFTDKLSVIHQLLGQETQLDVVYHDLLGVDRQQGRFSVLSIAASATCNYRNLLLYGNILSNSSVIVRRGFLTHHGLEPDVRREFISCEDYDLWLRCARAGAKFHGIHRLLGVYGISETGQSQNYIRHYSNTISLLKHHCMELQSFTTWRRWLLFRARSVIALRFSVQEFRGRKYLRCIARLLEAVARNAPYAVYYCVRKYRQHWDSRVLLDNLPLEIKHKYGERPAMCQAKTDKNVTVSRSHDE